MAHDKQLRGVELKDVLRKRHLGQALNAKEFAVLVDISYSTAREWFRLPSFPVIKGIIFWSDFVEWRRTQTGLNDRGQRQDQEAKPRSGKSDSEGPRPLLSRAARILSEAS